MKAIFYLMAALALALLPALPAAAEPPGTLEGRVVNGTAGGGPVAGLEVNLRPSSPEAGPDLRATTDSGGAFRFVGLSVTAPVSYTLSVNYAGVDYKSPAISFGQGEELKGVELPVYETTEDGDAIRADLAHLVLEVDPAYQTLVVLEFQALSNRGDKTHLGPPLSGSGKREALRFPLPRGATHVQPMEGLGLEALAPLAEGFADITPFPPGKREVAFSYMVEYTDRSYSFQRPLAYPTDRLNLLVTDVGAQVRAAGFSAQQTVDIGGKKYLLLSGEGLAQGQTLEVELAGLPLGQEAAKGATDNLKLAAMGLLPAALGAALVFFWLKGRRPQMRLAPAVVAPEDEKAQLLRSLAELDDSYEGGRLPEPEYQRLRAEKKRRLAEIW